MEEKKEKRVLTIELDDDVKKVSITGLGDDETVVMKQDLSDEELDQATGGYIPNSWQTIVITGVRSLGSDPVIIVVGTGT